MFKEDPLKLYKIKFATELIKWFLNGRLVNMMFLPEIYIEKEQIAGCKKMAKPCGNLLDILLELGL
jgi:hypothetical protein